MNLMERRKADRRANAIAAWRALGRRAERRKADRNLAISLKQGDWTRRYDAAKCALAVAR